MAIALALWPAPLSGPSRVSAQEEGGEPSMLVPNLAVRAAVDGLVTPTTMAFVDEDEMFVVEKNTGKVQYVAGGEIDHTALDLAVNFASERGLLGIALDPAFATNGYVYLYWTCSAPPPAGDTCFPTLVECPDTPELGADTDDIFAVPLLGNRVDRFVWDGTSLTWDLNLLKLRVFQNDACPVPAGQGDEGQRPAGNHNGGIIRFGPDGKLYVIIGDNGRRGWLQNLRFGPKADQQPPAVPDDQFGGPEPDDAHFTGVVIRINPDGTTPPDNPFAGYTSGFGPEVDENIHLIFAYGHRNSFGMAFDPFSGNLWTSENGDDTFDELNLVFAGHNSGWVQIMGPLERLAQYKAIETSEDFFGLQQLRWPPTNIADSQAAARSRLFLLPGASFSDPEYSWVFAVAPAAIGFVSSRAIGPQYEGDLFMGFSEPEPLGGPLLAFELTGNRRAIAGDRIVDNAEKHDLGSSEKFLVGRDFGIVTDIQTGPNGNLYVTSLTKGAVYEIFRTRGR